MPEYWYWIKVVLAVYLFLLILCASLVFLRK